MSANSLWIKRRLADEIHERIITENESAVVYLVQAPAGMGKTYLARDLGTRLGSTSGYEPSQLGKIVWSGILDIYDPDTNSNQGIERRLLQAFPRDAIDFFGDYQNERELYDAWFKGGVFGTSLEEQRKKVETAFSKGLEEVAKRWRPILVFDTVERLERAADPTQQELGFFDDTASVMGWLLFQISHLRQGVVLLLGRRADHFHEALKQAVEKANQERAEMGLRPIELLRKDLGVLDTEEIGNFFDNRVQRYPALRRLLTEDLKRLLAERTGGNPLLLDLALQGMLEKGDVMFVRKALEDPAGLRRLEQALLDAYMNSLSNPEREVLLRYLALARNGLFADLLRALEPKRADALLQELRRMEVLPFIKVREVTVAQPGSRKRVSRRTYFLHDAMYTLCDEMLLTPGQARSDSRRILDWYDEQIRSNKGKKSDGTMPLHPDPDLLVESLFYRMRVDPHVGYQWYLRQSDQAIRSAQTGLDMRLRDAMALFITSASEDEGEFGQSLSSPIDRENIKVYFPQIFDDFRLDSATQWVKRYTLRGKLNRAREIGEKTLGAAEEMYQYDFKRYALPMADFSLWYGQALMYGYEIEEAVKFYNKAIDLLKNVHPSDAQEETQVKESPDGFEFWRYTLVLGRAYNNLGYTRWMYQGKYNQALRDLHQAVRFFRLGGHKEELANSNDNMGRIHTCLGHEFQAIQLIRDGLEIRRQLRLIYREALSANSLALALLRFDQMEPALRSAEDALSSFRRAEVERGIGLGLITRGMIYRNMADLWREIGIPLDEALRHTDIAEADLKEAVRIFSVSVREPIRRVQACNEMGCCYRARYLLLREKGASDAERDIALTIGRRYFQEAINTARQHGYLVEELDSRQDLAVLFTRAGRYDEAKDILEEIRMKIPEEYHIRPGIGLVEVEESERVDAYYKLMGQVELLAGAIAFEEGRLKPGASPTREGFLKTALQYLLATVYFHHYSGKAFANRLTYSRMYKRFRECPPDLIQEITQKHLPEWAEEYKIPRETASGLFIDVFGLF